MLYRLGLLVAVADAGCGLNAEQRARAREVELAKLRIEAISDTHVSRRICDIQPDKYNCDDSEAVDGSYQNSLAGCDKLLRDTLGRKGKVVEHLGLKAARKRLGGLQATVGWDSASGDTAPYVVIDDEHVQPIVDCYGEQVEYMEPEFDRNNPELVKTAETVNEAIQFVRDNPGSVTDLVTDLSDPQGSVTDLSVLQGGSLAFYSFEAWKTVMKGQITAAIEALPADTTKVWLGLSVANVGGVTGVEGKGFCIGDWKSYPEGPRGLGLGMWKWHDVLCKSQLWLIAHFRGYISQELKTRHSATLAGVVLKAGTRGGAVSPLNLPEGHAVIALTDAAYGGSEVAHYHGMFNTSPAGEAQDADKSQCHIVIPVCMERLLSDFGTLSRPGSGGPGCQVHCGDPRSPPEKVGGDFILSFKIADNASLKLGNKNWKVLKSRFPTITSPYKTKRDVQV